MKIRMSFWSRTRLHLGLGNLPLGTTTRHHYAFKVSALDNDLIINCSSSPSTPRLNLLLKPKACEFNTSSWCVAFSHSLNRYCSEPRMVFLNRTSCRCFESRLCRSHLWAGDKTAKLTGLSRWEECSTLSSQSITITVTRYERVFQLSAHVCGVQRIRIALSFNYLALLRWYGTSSNLKQC